MRFVLSKTAVLLHLLLLVVFLASGYGRPSALGTYLPLVWLMLAAFEVLLLFPTALKGEQTDGSRERVRRKLLRDPMLYLGVAGILYFACQALNGPCSLAFNSATITWQLRPPPLPGLPSCFDRREAFQGFFWFMPAWTAILAVRHGLSRHGKARLLLAAVAVSAVLAVIGLLQYGMRPPPRLWGVPATPHQFGTFDYTGFAGAYFGMMFFVAGGLLIASMTTHASILRCRLLFAATLVNLIAATFTLNYGAMLFVWCGGLLGFIYACLYVFHYLTVAERLRSFVVVVVTLGALAFLHFVAYPENAVHARTKALLSGEAMSAVVRGERQVLGRAALSIFKAHPVYGAGTWGYRHEMGRFLDDEDWSRIAPANQQPITCFNDLLQFLCELGLFGVGLLLLASALLLTPVVRRLYVLLCMTTAQSAQIEATRIKRVSPVAVSCLFAVCGVWVVSWFDMPFRNPLVLLTWCLLLAILPGLLPIPKIQDTALPVRATRSQAGKRSPRRRVLAFRKRHGHHHPDSHGE
jgi:hypothetical protein